MHTECYLEAEQIKIRKKCLTEGVEGQQKKEGEGSSQGTCMKDPWQWATGWGLTGGVGVGGAGESNTGKIGTTVIEQQ